MSRSLALTAVLLVAVALPCTAASAAVVTASPMPDVATMLWLSGPFGRVPGGTLAEPATAAPDHAPLDAFVRGAPLLVDGADATGRTVRVVAISSEGSPEVLSTGAASFAGPSRAGRWRIVATLASPTGEPPPGDPPTGDPAAVQPVRAVWLVDVPERMPPVDGLFDIPAPDVLLGQGGSFLVGRPGDGCYVYLCVDVGQLAPLGDVPVMAVAVGDSLSVRLGDGSAIVGWEGSLQRIGSDPSADRTVSGTIETADGALFELPGLEVPGPGQWRLELKVTLDRERGWLAASYRLNAQ